MVPQRPEGFATAGGDVGIEFLVGFGDGVEEAPDVAALELPVGGFAPFLEHFGDLSGGDGSAIEDAVERSELQLAQRTLNQASVPPPEPGHDQAAELLCRSLDADRTSLAGNRRQSLCDIQSRLDDGMFRPAHCDEEAPQPGAPPDRRMVRVGRRRLHELPRGPVREPVTTRPISSRWKRQDAIDGDHFQAGSGNLAASFLVIEDHGVMVRIPRSVKNHLAIFV